VTGKFKYCRILSNQQRMAFNVNSCCVWTLQWQIMQPFTTEDFRVEFRRAI
jgi:hypothetical protein